MIRPPLCPEALAQLGLDSAGACEPAPGAGARPYAQAHPPAEPDPDECRHCGAADHEAGQPSTTAVTRAASTSAPKRSRSSSDWSPPHRPASP